MGERLHADLHCHVAWDHSVSRSFESGIGLRISRINLPGSTSHHRPVEPHLLLVWPCAGLGD